MRNVPGLEAVYHDYKSRDVQFFYVYKALAHPENDGYVQPVTLEERLAHIARAKEELGTKIPWLADTMENDLKHAFGNRNNSEFVVSPEGMIFKARAWSDPEALRADLEKYVGISETLTKIEDLEGVKTPPAPSKAGTGIVPRVKRPKGAQPLVVKSTNSAGDEILYAKLRAEAGPDAIREGKGSLYLGFFLDPIHRVHWNNLAAPLKFTIAGPEGVTVSPAEGSAPKVEAAESDLDPREFLVEVDFGESDPDKPLNLTVNYFACDDGDKWCKAVRHEFAIYREIDKDGGRVRSTEFLQNHRPGSGTKGRRPTPEGVLERFDLDNDGAISREEASGPVERRFDLMDKDGDGIVSGEELRAHLSSRPGQ